MSIVHRDRRWGSEVRTPNPGACAGQALVQILYAAPPTTSSTDHGRSVDVLATRTTMCSRRRGRAGRAALPEAEQEGRMAIGQLVLVDPMVFNRQAPT